VVEPRAGVRRGGGRVVGAPVAPHQPLVGAPVAPHQPLVGVPIAPHQPLVGAPIAPHQPGRPIVAHQPGQPAAPHQPLAPGRPAELELLARAADLLRALASPVRLAILRQIADVELCVHEIVDALYDSGVPASQPLVSQHLRVLREHDLVRTRRRGREVAYRLADHHIGHIVADAVTHSVEPGPSEVRTDPGPHDPAR
jgi:DNA-binding transcriptional ArsR family regulator